MMEPKSSLVYKGVAILKQALTHKGMEFHWDYGNMLSNGWCHHKPHCGVAALGDSDYGLYSQGYVS